MKKVLTLVALVLVVLIVGLAGFVTFTWDRTYAATYPEVQSVAESSAIAHGRHLVYGPAHCSSCHVPQDRQEEVNQGEFVPLSGGWEIDIPPGTFWARNLTPDPETGIGGLSDQEIARVLRYSVGADGRPIFPFMPFQDMSDEDMGAIIAFLRSQEPVHNVIEPSSYTVLGKIILSLGLIKPEGPQEQPSKTVVRDSTAAYGLYLANNIANCAGCHTNRDLMTGDFIGPRFAGGMLLPPEEASKGYAFVTPNLTPDPETGWIVSWSEDAFIQRFRSGRVIETSPMPWDNFARMDSLELKALYRFLHSLEPINNPVPKVVFAPGEELPES